MSYDINSRHNDLVRAMLAIVGKSDPLKLGPDLHAVVVLEDERPERSFAAGERYWGTSITVGAGGAGVRSEVLIKNPLNSGVLTTVLLVSVNGDAFLGFADGSGTPAGFVGSFSLHFTDKRLDPGLDGTRFPTTQGFFKNTGVATGVRQIGLVQNIKVGERNHVAILQPGAQLVILAGTDNLAITAAIFGREVAFVAAGQKG